MNCYQITLNTGATPRVMGEGYNSDPVSGLIVFDQFGNTTASYAVGTYSAVTIINPNAPVLPQGQTTLITDNGT